ncbi:MULTISPECIES: MerR family transcriptional regulator [Oceanobacillus]|uniref:MerR family transcriptional regulator n=1 Tax=Oceanobacillus TaxID=182709 RepID=UPI00034AD628|nr:MULTISPECIES: MerR family transcriptional regulator [Oceanobacillus]MBT2600080.1 MerR family transcriptional regulator [Oceanobacillus sp. ISL-74]MBT2652472.1 MerR family transcriptional regulator [Oceanobacillus sp. ISL-73]
MFLSIKEAAEEVSIPPSTIRYYDSQGLLPSIKRDKNGSRQFEESDLFWLEMIGSMRDTGMSINKLRKVAQLRTRGTSTVEERKKLFKEHKEKLLKERENIDYALHKLSRKMELLEQM